MAEGRKVKIFGKEIGAIVSSEHYLKYIEDVFFYFKFSELNTSQKSEIYEVVLNLGLERDRAEA